jgi:hypothetical protein
MVGRARQDLVTHRITVHNQLLALLQHCFSGAVGLFSQLNISISLASCEGSPLSRGPADWSRPAARPGCGNG